MLDIQVGGSELRTLLEQPGLEGEQVDQTVDWVEANVDDTAPYDLERIEILSQCFLAYQSGALFPGASAATHGCGTDDTNFCYATEILNQDTDDSDGLYDIEHSPRFSWVPQFHAESFGNGSSAHYHMRRLFSSTSRVSTSVQAQTSRSTFLVRQNAQALPCLLDGRIASIASQPS